MQKNNKFRRRSRRLNGYDYSSTGAYFVTICTHNRECLLGEVINGAMVLNNAGKMVEYNWNKLPQRFPNIEMDEFIVMPNHLHGIVTIVVGAPLVGAQNDATRAPIKGAPTSGGVFTACIVNNDHRAPIKVAPTLGEIIGAFKSITTNEYIDNVKNNNWRSFNKHLWQHNYYEHVIRGDMELNGIRQYIMENPLKWDTDSENPNKIAVRLFTI